MVLCGASVTTSIKKKKKRFATRHRTWRCVPVLFFVRITAHGAESVGRLVVEFPRLARADRFSPSYRVQKSLPGPRLQTSRGESG